MNQKPRHDFQDNFIFGLLAVGLVLMVGVIHFGEEINSFWAVDTTTSELAASKPTPMVGSEDAQKIYIQAVLNQPENIYNPTVDKLTPTQEILAGGTKFLVGF